MKRVFDLLRPYVRPYRRSMVFALCAMAGEIVTALLQPLPLQLAVTRILKPEKAAHGIPSIIIWQLLALGILSIVIAVADSVVTYLDVRRTGEVAQRAVADLRISLFGHVQRLSLAFHTSRDTRSGDLLLRLSNDVQALQDAITTWPSNAITNGGTALLMLALLFAVNHLIGIVVLATAVPVFLVIRHYHRRLKHVTRLARKQEGRVTSSLSEALGAAKLIQALGREDNESERVKTLTDAGVQYGMQAIEYQARSQPVVALLTSACTAMVLVLGSLLALNHQISIGTLILVLAYAKGVFGALRQLSKLSYQTQRASAAAERISELFKRAPGVADPIWPVTLPPRHSRAIALRNVSFGYQAGSPVIRDVSFEVPAGKTVAVVGPTGSGKSTLVSLMMRFYDPWNGAVTLDGVDVKELLVAEVRSSMSLVLQESLLFRETVWTNIAMGRPSARSAEILKAAELGGVTRFIDDLDDGFGTVISERGGSLSGGQRQCVAIARAILRNSPVVILDEPTSSLDAVTEQFVVDGIHQLLAGRTAIVIAHRLSTIRNADLIVVMEKGRIADHGTPAELNRREGLFQKMAHLQAVDFGAIG